MLGAWRNQRFRVTSLLQGRRDVGVLSRIGMVVRRAKINFQVLQGRWSEKAMSATGRYRRLGRRYTGSGQQNGQTSAAGLRSAFTWEENWGSRT